MTSASVVVQPAVLISQAKSPPLLRAPGTNVNSCDPTFDGANLFRMGYAVGTPAIAVLIG
jgi:hypothetical protein